MASSSTVSKSTHTSAHIGVIVFHILLALTLIYTQMANHISDRTKYVSALSVGGVLLIVSLLAIVPIASGSGYEKDD